MKKNMSSRQLAANQRNAQKSTGPKTAAGKAVSRLNALKHGLLAQSVVVQGHRFKESGHEFKKLCQEFHARLAPEGPLEELLVGQIVSAAWRLRRARMAESGEIALSVDTGWWRRENHNPLPLLLALPPNPVSEGLVAKLQRSAWGCRYLIHCLMDVRQSVKRQGELSQEAVDAFNGWLRGNAESLGQDLGKLRDWLTANPENLEAEALRARHKDDVLKFLDCRVRDLERWLEQHEEREEAEERARQAAAVLPSEAVLDKILRYETALERQLFRAMNQLERIQRRRLGEDVTAPLAVEVSTRS